MRISFQTGYRDSLADIERSAEAMAKYQRQVSSGKRLQAPSDDPTAAVGAVAEHTEIGAIDQYIEAADSANSRLTVIDTVLGDMIEKLRHILGSVPSAPAISERRRTPTLPYEDRMVVRRRAATGRTLGKLRGCRISDPAGIRRRTAGPNYKILQPDAVDNGPRNQ